MNSITLDTDQLNSALAAIPNAAVVVRYTQESPEIVSYNSIFEVFVKDAPVEEGMAWQSLMPDCLENEFEEIHTTLSEGEDCTTEFELSRDGNTKYFEVTGTADTDSEGTAIGFLVLEDVTPEDNTAKELKAELDEATDELQQLAYVVSHDLKEPIRMITSYLDLLEMEVGDELGEDAEEYIYFAVDGADRMQTLLDDLLQYSRINTHADAHVDVDFSEAIETAQLTLTAEVESTGAQFEIADMPTIPAEHSQSDELFEQLFKNSLSYVDDETQPEISVVVTDLGEKYQFKVSDNGVGIPDDQQNRVFDVFTRGPDADNYSDGEGIGLSICKRIVENHGGEIWIESTGENGTTIAFTLSKENSNPA